VEFKTSATRLVLTLLTVSAPSVHIVAQTQEHYHAQHHRYKFVELGTFGGPLNYLANEPSGGGAAAGILNARGTIVSAADTSVPDPNYPNTCLVCPSDPLIFHAFRWHGGVLTDMGSLAGTNSSFANSVSESGLMTGFSENSAIDPLLGVPEIDGVLWKDGKIINLGHDRGNVAGTAENDTPDSSCIAPQVLHFKPVIWEEGEIHELPTVAGDPDGVAFAINDRGQAAGVSGDCTLTPGHALLWHDGKVTDMGTLGGLALTPSDLNNQVQPQVVGTAFNNTTNRAFLWQDGMARDLGTLPGDAMGHGNAINDKGEVVGQSCDVSNNCRAFLWRHGVMNDLNTLIPSDTALYLVDPQGIKFLAGRSWVVQCGKRRRICSFLGDPV